MSGNHWFASPLAGTAGVLAGLCLLAVPLRKLTSAAPVPAAPAAKPVAASNEISAVLRLRMLAPATRVTLRCATGKIVLEQKNLPAGESEHDAMIPFDDGRVELILQADFGDAAADTAVFLTVMPDGFEDQTRYAIGSGVIEEPLLYEWHVH